MGRWYKSCLPWIIGADDAIAWSVLTPQTITCNNAERRARKAADISALVEDIMTTPTLNEDQIRIRRAARADALLCVLAETFPHPLSRRTLDGWPLTLRAALADREAFAAWLAPRVHLEACDSPARDLLTSYLLGAERQRPPCGPAWPELAWVGPFMQLLDDRCAREGPAELTLGREEVLAYLEQAVTLTRARLALLPEVDGPLPDDAVRRAIVMLATPYADERPDLVEATLMATIGQAVRILHRARGARTLHAAAPATPELVGELAERIGGVLDCVPGMADDCAALAILVDEARLLRPLAAAVLAWDGDAASGVSLLTAWRAALLRELDAGHLPAAVYASGAAQRSKAA